MNRLQKFIEQGAYGEKPGRTAYALARATCRSPAKARSGERVDALQCCRRVMRDAGLKDVFKTAIASGCAVVSNEI